VRIVVSVDESACGLEVRVHNDPTAQGEVRIAGGGRGLVGLRERIETLGGQFSAGRTGVGGWAVEARLPSRVSRPELPASDVQGHRQHLVNLDPC
jgi:signal transduction histidine kinase